MSAARYVENPCNFPKMCSMLYLCMVEPNMHAFVHLYILLEIITFLYAIQLLFLACKKIK